MFKFYEVGGCVRDEIMGIKSKDIDYTVVANSKITKGFSVDEVFNSLHAWLLTAGYTIWLSTPSCFTIRAKFPEDHPHEGVTADFVLARKEIGYKPGTRQPIVTVGTLLDDLERRDFTVNAMARDIDGNLFDPFNGMEDIKNKVLRTPLPCTKTFNDDPLRILRAIRFSITKGFLLSDTIHYEIDNFNYIEKMNVVSEERIREELHKCFKHNSFLTIVTLFNYPKLMEYIFNFTKLWLCPTTKE